MREPMHRAAARRDDRLARIRKLSLWITGGAAAASLGLGTAFAHALPGHAATSNSPTTTSPGAASSPVAGSSHLTSPSPAANAGSKSASHKTGRHSAKKLTKPVSAPKPTQAPPVVSSGGS